MLVRVDSTDKFDNSTLSEDCRQEQFRNIEASMYQVLHRATANEPLIMVSEPKDLGDSKRGAQSRGGMINGMYVRQKSTFAAPISNISEPDRVNDVEQLDDILRTFIKETNKFLNMFGLDTLWCPVLCVLSATCD